LEATALHFSAFAFAEGSGATGRGAETDPFSNVWKNSFKKFHPRRSRERLEQLRQQRNKVQWQTLENPLLLPFFGRLIVEKNRKNC